MMLGNAAMMKPPNGQRRRWSCLIRRGRSQTLRAGVWRGPNAPGQNQRNRRSIDSGDHPQAVDR